MPLTQQFSHPKLQNLVNSLQLPSPVTEIKTPLLTEKKVSLYIKRDELIHPVIQGNKWRKLKYNIIEAMTLGHDTVLSFGGAYSNHLHALAALSKECGLKSIAIVRGEKPEPLGPTLKDIQDWGMQMEFVNRKQYREKNTASFISSLKQKYGSVYIIPEGGNNLAGVKGCSELLNEIAEHNMHFDSICCELGSGTMMSALINANPFTNTAYLGFAVMKNQNITNEITALIHHYSQYNNVTDTNTQSTEWKIISDYHFGGYAKTTNQLNLFIQDFWENHKIQLEPVYSAKMIYGLFDMIKNDAFKPGHNILAIHGGGLQGLRGYPSLHNTHFNHV